MVVATIVVVEAEEEGEVGVMVGVLTVLLRLWDKLYNDFCKNSLMKNNWLSTDRPTDERTHPLIEMRGRT